MGAYHSEPARAGVLLDANGLQPSSLGCRIRYRGGERSIVDRPFTESKGAPNAKQDHGFMYGHGFEDLDGHVWELSYLDMGAIPAQA